MWLSALLSHLILKPSNSLQLLDAKLPNLLKQMSQTDFGVWVWEFAWQ